VTRLADLARSFELSGGISFRGFVEELEAQAEKEDAAEAPVLEEDSDGVRLLTVHGAKGLEFRVVILADLTANLASREPDQFIDGQRRLSAVRLLRCAPHELAENEARESARERAEGIRVAYVAATRARDLLVVPAIGDEAFDGWLGPLNKALYPSRAGWRKSSRAAGCPEFGLATVLERPMDYDREEEFSVKPGLIQPEHGTHEVVWWDPSKLTLDVDGGLGIRQQLLVDDGGASLAEYRAWQAERARVLAVGSTLGLDVFLASQAQTAPAGAIVVEISSTAKTGVRPGGRRFGTLVHSVLRDVALDAAADSIKRMVRSNSRAIGATEQESEAARAAVTAALAHPLITAARRAERCYREYPVTLRLDGDRVVEGVIDLAFLEEGRWTIVDFKTDADTAEVRAQYQRQLQWYAFAMTEMTGLPARGVLLGV
jgi:ATP-dependent exoDNAse (exonuclease V) beta subunit